MSKPNSNIIIYKSTDGGANISVKVDDEDVWLTQQLMAELFQTTKQNISFHIQNIFKENELTPEATVKKYLKVRKEVNREVSRELEHYNLDMIISVGYRVKSTIAANFRIWD